MAYTQSPMEHYNKNHPLTILCKQVYDTIMDEIQLFTKGLIVRSSIQSIIWLGSMGWTIGHSVYDQHVHPLDLIILCTGVVLILYYFFRSMGQCRYYMLEHPGMREFDRLSNMEMSEITELGVEDLLKSLHGEYELLGGLRSTVGFLNRIGSLICALMGGCLIGQLIFYRVI